MGQDQGSRRQAHFCDELTWPALSGGRTDSDPERSDASSDVFVNEDGSLTEKTYGGAVNFKAEDGSCSCAWSASFAAWMPSTP